MSEQAAEAREEAACRDDSTISPLLCLLANTIDALSARLARAEEVIEAARALDEEMSEEHSQFDSDGVYVRYWRYRREESFAKALASSKRSAPVSEGASGRS